MTGDYSHLRDLRPQSEPDGNGETAAGAGPDRFFDRGSGLKVQTLAEAVRLDVQLARLNINRDSDGDDALWHYKAGVWRPGGATAAERACGHLLGERLRTAHVGNVLLALRTGSLTTLRDDPPHPGAINFRDTMLRWEDSETLDHDPKLCSTVQLAVPWEPDAECPKFLAWLEQMLPEHCPDFAFEMLGYLMLNGNPLHKAFMLRGTGRNGKGTFLRIAKALLGARNCATVPLQTLGENRFAAADLHMRLANIAGDLDARHIEDTSIFKMVTGEDPIRAERKFGHAFSFVPWAVPIFSANQTPGASDTSVGYLSRWEVLPFPVDLTGREDRSIEAHIRSHELPGVARHAVAGLRRLMTRGRFDRPDAVNQAHEEFEADIDQVRAWVNECCERNPETWTSRTVLHDTYRRWASLNDRGVLAAGHFYDRLQSAGFRPAKREGTRGFVGLRP